LIVRATPIGPPTFVFAFIIPASTLNSLQYKTMPTPATQKSNAKLEESNKKQGSRAPPKPNDKAFRTALDENRAKIDKLQEQLVSFYSGSGQSEA